MEHYPSGLFGAPDAVRLGTLPPATSGQQAGLDDEDRMGHAATMDLSMNEGTLVVTGGPGDSFQTAIVIRKTPKGLSAAGAEHLLIAQRHGQRGQAWTLTQQELLKQNGRMFDVLRITLADGTCRTLHFDVTDWLDRVSASR